jgi:heme-degrading monooxygenase HmoA
MSVLVIGKFRGDTAKFRRALSERAGELEKYGQMGRAAGALHHRFAIGDGFVLVVDEWQSAEQFQQFFTNPELQQFIGEIGADTSSPPELMVTEAVASTDQF